MRRFLSHTPLPSLMSVYRFSTKGMMCLCGVLALSLVPLLTVEARTSMPLKSLVRVKDVRENQLMGYGLVVGLAGTGDGSVATQTAQWNMLNNLGGRIGRPADLMGKNAAQVMVTASISPFAKAGDRMDITVSAIGNTKSLEGGTLMATQLLAPNGEVIAVAQGPLSTGGSMAGSGGSSKRTAIVTTARVPGGAIVEREMQTQMGDAAGLTLVLDRTDFTLATRIAGRINSSLAPALAVDGSSIRVQVPGQYQGNRVAFLSMIEQMEVELPTTPARVVVNERTGTVVIGSGVKLLPAAVAHGGITVSITNNTQASQPGAFSGGSTALVSNDTVDIQEQSGSLVELGTSHTLNDLVSALNAIGVTPNDLISILQALKAAGALEAELEII
jgi:flagellar P-ring protein FlgI